MAATETIQIRVDHETKAQVTHILESLRVNMSDAIKIYLQQIILNNGIPFEVRIPNRKTLKAMADVDAGRNLIEVADADELIKELNR
ncbi:MAG: type II toxin-antitoxin system RelB/DinJ family antitoxin [Sedimentisphaerales bacterium]|nr:type II toxin-antitoxin system RelB/DinJ family antitoxin [Sedimentisphaerales bacterium]